MSEGCVAAHRGKLELALFTSPKSTTIFIPYSTTKRSVLTPLRKWPPKTWLEVTHSFRLAAWIHQRLAFPIRFSNGIACVTDDASNFRGRNYWKLTLCCRFVLALAGAFVAVVALSPLTRHRRLVPDYFAKYNPNACVQLFARDEMTSLPACLIYTRLAYRC